MTDLNPPQAPDAEPARRDRPRARAAARPVIAPPIYDLPELKEANDALASAVADRLEAAGFDRPVPARGRAPAWERLAFGQVCGYRYMKQLSGLVRPLAIPRYRAQGSDGAFVRSAVLVRANDGCDGLAELRGRRLALSPTDLNSANLLRAEVAPLAAGGAFFSDLVERSGLAGGAEALAEGEADAALIDGVALAHLRRFRPQLWRGLRILFWTARSPGPPFVTSLASDPQAVQAVERALKDLATDPRLKATRDELLIGGLDSAEEGQYRAVIHCEQIADSLGYPDLK